ncbi:MAG: hypothetical protein CVU48_03080 [Candidatus Cloacimonetes bacterium HGW-Cloacimonetes-1]|jgi:glycosyltransferase involved in cell wall biosynthesis|nr:MAG: hypothetical protein CVU48_03080 [Candidatus Cloacimonetes bacterium HGW-Cloacimonetes-1]
MKKILYVDVPFQGLQGGDKNRSQFIWGNLCKQFDADLVLIRTPDFATQPIPEHTGYDQCIGITASDSLPFSSPAIYHFSQSQKQKFRELLNRKRYEIIVFRFLSCFSLAKIAKATLPQCKIVIDVDMLFSRIAELSWNQNKSFKNRYYFMELVKLRAFEALAFRYDFMFYFTNSFERDLAIERYKLKDTNAYLFPNMMPSIPDEFVPQVAGDQKYILFFGTLNSAANQDGFLYLASEIYPRIAKKLQEKDIYIYVVGKKPTPIYQKYAGTRIKIIGPVDDITSVIANALFIILPLRVASGTRTRILEAATLKKGVITTEIGVEGLDFDTNELAICNDANGFAKTVIQWLQSPTHVCEKGELLYHKASQLYSQETVTNNFLSSIIEPPKDYSKSSEPSKKLKIAIITNRFYPEVGGAETNIYYQARKLAAKYDVTVICPKRIKKPRVENLEIFKVIRMWDIFNLPAKYPYLKAKTLCVELFFHLIFSDYDIIQCYPALNYNNIIAFIAAKLTDKPFILCFFDFIDYAGVIKRDGKIDPDILRSIQPSLNQRFVLKGMDYAFAIADKEIEFLRRFNPNVEYSPVPILIEEYDIPTQDPRSQLGIDDDSFTFLCLGRVSNIKGQDIALQAFAKAHRNMPGAKLIFVGRTDYETPFYEMLQAFVTQNSLSEKVLFTGMLERDQVLGWLRYSDIHVVPVRFMNSGAVVVESWISDTPVIQSNVVDPNLVVEDYNGYLFPSENVDELARKMILAFQSRDRLPQLAENGKALVKSKYTYDYLTDIYTRAYYKLLER